MPKICMNSQGIVPNFFVLILDEIVATFMPWFTCEVKASCTHQVEGWIDPRQEIPALLGIEPYSSSLYIVITPKYSDSTLHYKVLQYVNITAYVRFEFLMVVATKITAFWHVMLCSVVEIHRHLEQPVASIFRLEYV